jgi:uncharacterized UPF0146 family protein
MGGYKHIEMCVGRYIAEHYKSAVEIGIGKNTTAAQIIRDAGRKIRCTDICNVLPAEGLDIVPDDVFDPEPDIYEGADVIYAIRPAIEMVPPMIALARRTGADLIVCHLGFECYGDGGEIIDCGVILHRYYRHLKPSKSVD